MLAIAIAIVAVGPSTAHAQVHGDLGFQGGVERPLFGGGAGSGAFGPRLGVDAHVALLPLVRIGAYTAFAIAPTSDAAPARHVLSAGAHAKILAPWVRGDFRLWLGVGAGYAAIYAPSYRTTVVVTHADGSPPTPTDALVIGAGGGRLEVPVGLGGAWRFRKPWALTLEIGALFGFAHTGSVYTGRHAYLAGDDFAQNVAALGKDYVTPFATAGVSLDL